MLEQVFIMLHLRDNTFTAEYLGVASMNKYSHLDTDNPQPGKRLPEFEAILLQEGFTLEVADPHCRIWTRRGATLALESGDA